MKRIAVYGTLREGYGNHGYVRNATKIGIGTTKEKYTMFASGIPFVDKATPTSTIVVEVYDVSDEDMPSVDRLEGHPYVYKRESIDVIMENGEEVQAELYFYPVTASRERGLTLVKSGDYTDYREPIYT